ncbi:AAA family ATPase, partial [Collimonas pratensis]|uniref:AAA family ATPase n=1 Tax=Collimonas pratensis TaxID=279113 RepID=UPI00143E0050
PSVNAIAVGLEEIDMPRLGRFVAIAGKNGSGKTRLLEQLQISVEMRTNGLPQLGPLRANIHGLTESIRQRSVEVANVYTWNLQLKTSEDQIKNILGRIIADEKSEFKALRFVPKSLDLADARSDPSQILVSRYASAKIAHIDQYSGLVLGYIQQLQNRWWNASHQNFPGTLAEKENTLEEYEGLNQLIFVMLGVRLGRSIDGDALIFNMPLAQSNLSAGQKVILQLAAILHAQGGALNNTVFILDELENHLHPSATIEILEKLNAVAPSAQIWIATHSISL